MSSYISVKKLLRSYLAIETLDDKANLFDCFNCGGKHKAHRQLHFQSWPQILVIQLSRSFYNTRTLLLEKHATPVRINCEVRGVDFSYELYAIIVHIGESTQSGHYIAHVRGTEGTNKSWYTMNDKSVEKCSESELKELLNEEADIRSFSTPYILFYRKIIHGKGSTFQSR